MDRLDQLIVINQLNVTTKITQFYTGNMLIRGSDNSDENLNVLHNICTYIP
jgi:hypothetical protein